MEGCFVISGWQNGQAVTPKGRALCQSESPPAVGVLSVMMGAAHHRQSPFESICFPHYSPIPHGVAPQQSSTTLQTAAAKVHDSFYITEILTMKCSLQFELLTTYYSKSACKNEPYVKKSYLESNWTQQIEYPISAVIRV